MKVLGDIRAILAPISTTAAATSPTDRSLGAQPAAGDSRRGEHQDAAEHQRDGKIRRLQGRDGVAQVRRLAFQRQFLGKDAPGGPSGAEVERRYEQLGGQQERYDAEHFVGRETEIERIEYQHQRQCRQAADEVRDGIADRLQQFTVLQIFVRSLPVGNSEGVCQKKFNALPRVQHEE